MRRLSILLLSGSILLSSCQKTEKSLFRLVSPEESGIEFSNNLTYDEDFNIFRYRNYYNGGGVALADLNGDGLIDIFLVANMGPNRLFQNLGDLKFEDITESAGVGGTRAWSTGVSIADINGDGHPDIYVCNSGDIKGDNKQNELFINNGDATFTEKAAEYGLADRGFSTHAAFFDYDKDGDLDMYLLNNSYQAIGSFNLRKNERPIRDPIGGDKMYRNDGKVFTDVSEQAGIYGSVIGFGLGVTVGDVNADGWEDIYVSNDFFERDYLYVNNQKGGFEEVLEDHIKATSAASMGADLADLNNDGLPEIFVTDMLPDKNERIKTVTTFDSWDRYQYSVSNGYWHQFTRNTLQLNNGDGSFSEIGRFSGVDASDWSWGALIFDFENDGLKDIFIANGIYQDLTNQDFLQFASQEEIVSKITEGGKVDYESLIAYIPSVPIPNHAYVNNGDLTFSNRALELGLNSDSFSSGSAYGDLDNDGDLDLVVNNTNMPFFLYENQTEKLHPENRYLRFNLKGEGMNTNGLGTKISVSLSDKSIYLEHLPTRGFQSTVDNRPLIGLGRDTLVKRIEVIWPSGKVTELLNVAADQEVTVVEKDAIEVTETKLGRFSTEKSWFVELDSSVLSFVHQENQFVDFDRDRLTFHMISSMGPCMCTGDVNNDGLEDVFLGGASGFAGKIYIQMTNGLFQDVGLEVFQRTKASEDVDCALFDANGDGNLDIYVASGGNEFVPGASELNDRFFLGDGKAGFSLVRKTLPAGRFESSSVVTNADFDADGDQDLFVGLRLKPFFYGQPTNGYLLLNDGSGDFSDITAQAGPDLLDIGMITDAQWVDLDGDDDFDLVVVGEWMPVTVFKNENGQFKRESITAFQNSTGWWNVVEIGDLNSDGLPDLVVGNHGLNTRFRASVDYPLNMFVKDFDSNGTVEQIICQYEGEKLYPLPLRHDLAMQMPYVKKRYLKYDSYKDQQITDIFSPEELDAAVRLQVQELATSIYINKGNLDFERNELPYSVQLSTTYAISIEDYNSDQIPDILLGGNLYSSKPEVGRYDASYGSLLIGDGLGHFEAIAPHQSGISIDRQVRELKRIKTADGYYVLVANNNDVLQVFKPNPGEVPLEFE